MRATAPSGNAAYEGRVGWSGELGYGVRDPEGGQAHEDAPAEVLFSDDHDLLGHDEDSHTRHDEPGAGHGGH